MVGQVIMSFLLTHQVHLLNLLLILLLVPPLHLGSPSKAQVEQMRSILLKVNMHEIGFTDLSGRGV